MIFKSRQEAGKKLGELLKKKPPSGELIVLGLPRGGVVVAYEVAKALGAPLDILCPRKIGAPFSPELAIGAVSSEGTSYFFEDLVQRLHVSQEYLERKETEELLEAKRRLALYRSGRGALNIKKKTVIIVDDGLATGATMRVAILEAKKLGASKIVMAVPVAPIDTFQELTRMVNESYSLSLPEDFSAVGQFYSDFSQVLDEEVVALLKQ